MRRRDFVATVACGAVAWSLDARAQRSARPYRIGVLWHAASAEQEGPLYRALLEGFSNLGYVEGRDITFEHRFPNEMPERFRSMAAELVSLNVDVIVSSGNNASPYARNATATIPVVFMLVADPVATGMVESFARPGGNATGISNFASELIEKRLQILKDIVPHLSNVAMLVNPTAQISQLYIDVARSAATRLGVTLRTFEARSRGEIEPAFKAMTSTGMQAVLTNGDGLAYAQRELIADLALRSALPLAVFTREALTPGALLSYGSDSLEICRRTATYVDKILKGARPNDIPVERATKFEFLLNLRTAKALGLELPPSLLARADEVIE